MSGLPGDPGADRFVRSIVHATDLSSSSDVAFAHALAIALVRQTRLDILNVGSESSRGWSHFPSVRATLERWGLLAPGSNRSAVYDELSVRVKKVQLEGDPVRRTLEYVRESEPDLLVFSTRDREGLGRWLEPSIPATVARRSRTMTLFVGSEGRGFVRPGDGYLSLHRILIPIDRTPDATEAIEMATKAATALGDPPVEITLLHVGSGPLPDYPRPEGAGWAWHEACREGDVADEILSVAAELDTDLIVMATDGRNGFLDAIRGSFTERVVSRLPCPLLAVPAETRE